jgi:hypothetical protein
MRPLLGEHEVACHFAEELLPGARRDQLIADAARSSSPFATAEDEAVTPVGAPPVDGGGGLFDRGQHDPSGETQGRL